MTSAARRCTAADASLGSTPAVGPISTSFESPRSISSRSRATHAAGGPVHIGYHPVVSATRQVGALVVVHDLRFVENRSQATKRYLIMMLAGLGLFSSLLTLLVARWSRADWLEGTRALLRRDNLEALPPAAASAL